MTGRRVIVGRVIVARMIGDRAPWQGPRTCRGQELGEARARACCPPFDDDPHSSCESPTDSLSLDGLDVRNRLLLISRVVCSAYRVGRPGSCQCVSR